METELHRCSLHSLVELVQRGNAGAVEIAQSCIGRIEQHEASVQAFSWFDPQRALEQAREIDGRPSVGPLAGIPLGVKDIIDVANWPASWGSPIYQDRIPTWDASCVALCRESGANIFAKTVTTEFAYFYPGKTMNPHNPKHTPGGSSMGSAAAVADLMLPFAFGTQTAASVIRPAAYCGVIGYKASYGSFDLQGICGLAPGLDTLGFICRSLRDIPLVRSVLCADQPTFETRPDDDPPRIGMVRTPHWQLASDSTQVLLEKTADRLAKSGAVVDALEIPAEVGDLAEHQQCVMAFEAARSRAYEYHAHRDQLSPQFIELIENGLTISLESYQLARSKAVGAREWLDNTFEKFDLLLTPSAPDEAPEGLEATGNPIFSRLWTLLHVPSITLPAGSGPNGLPLGIQLVGRMDRDLALVRDADWAARALELTTYQ